METEQKFQGFGVSACATCDGFFFRGKEVAVVGGGNTAVEEALYLTNHATKVTLIHRRDTLRAEKILQERLLKHDRIEVLWDSAVDEVVGTEDPLGVTGVKVRNVKTDAITDLAVDLPPGGDGGGHGLHGRARSREVHRRAGKRDVAGSRVNRAGHRDRSRAG